MTRRVVGEGVPFKVDSPDDRYLQRVLGSSLQRAEGGSWRVDGRIGHVTLPSGTVLEIRSRKATAASVLAWLAFADPALSAFKELGRAPATLEEGTLGEVAARLFCSELARQASRHGLRRAYQRTRVDSVVVRGRIDFGALARRGGNLSRVPCVVWERIPATPLNRFLAMAAGLIRKDRLLSAAAGPRLSEVEAVLLGIPPAADEALLAGRRPLSRTEEPFRLACTLARLIIRCSGVVEGHTESGPAFLVDVADLFERGIARAFLESPHEALAKFPLPYRRHDEDGSAAGGAMQVDLYLPRIGGCPLVVDAKYKQEPSSGNLQQMISYCHMTGARRAVLVFPDTAAARPGRRYVFPARGAGEPVEVAIACLRTDATSVSGWRAAGRKLVEDVESLWK